MKNAIIGIGLMICGTIGLSTQRIIDTLFVVNDWTITHSGFNLLSTISFIAIVIGVILCVLSKKGEDK